MTSGIVHCRHFLCVSRVGLFCGSLLFVSLVGLFSRFFFRFLEEVPLHIYNSFCVSLVWDSFVGLICRSLW